MGYCRRRVTSIASCALATLAVLCLSHQNANAGVYVVNDCFPAVGASGWAGLATHSGTPTNSAFDWSKLECKFSAPTNLYSWVKHIPSRTYSSGDIGVTRWKLPAGLRFAGLRGGVREAWSTSGFLSRVQFLGPGAANAVNLNDDLLGHAFYVSTSADRDVFRAYVKCNATTCKHSSASPPPHTMVGELRMVVEDMTPPAVSFGGLATTTYNSGTKTLTVTGTDNNSGVQNLYAYVNGHLVINQANPSCAAASYITSFVPCGGSFSKSISVDTTASPWFEGINDLMICARNINHESSIYGVGPYRAYTASDTECSRHNILVLNP